MNCPSALRKTENHSLNLNAAWKERLTATCGSADETITPYGSDKIPNNPNNRKPAIIKNTPTGAKEFVCLLENAEKPMVPLRKKTRAHPIRRNNGSIKMICVPH